MPQPAHPAQHLINTKKYRNSALFNCLNIKPKGNDVYLKDKEQKALSFMRKTVSDSAKQYIQKLNKLIGQADMDIIINSAQIQTEADSYLLEEQNSIYPPKE